MEIAQIQHLIQQGDEKDPNPFRSAAEILTAMIEESGEVAQEVALLERIGTKAQWSKPASRERLSEEMVQLLNTIFALANYYQIDLEQAYTEYLHQGM